MKKKISLSTKLLLLTLLIFNFQLLTLNSFSQVGINTTGNMPNEKALLDLDASPSNDKGLLVPRLTTTERNTIEAPIPESLLIYNTTTQCFEAWNETSSTWVAFGCIGSTSFTPGCGTGTTIVDVTNPTTGKTWMNRNLGASQQATSSTDYLAYGALFQWGRAADGHECITWTSSTNGTPQSSTTSTLATSNTPGHSDFITNNASPYDWRNPQNNNLWQGVSGTNNPCPSGYRLPTEAEWEAERTSWSSNNAAGAFASPLKLPVAGRRGSSDGSLSNVGSDGRYWSSTVGGAYSRSLGFASSNANMHSNSRASGLSVRCLKD
jgi:uncharacterized protein (TIGR02145 family)